MSEEQKGPQVLSRRDLLRRAAVSAAAAGVSAAGVGLKFRGGQAQDATPAAMPTPEPLDTTTGSYSTPEATPTPEVLNQFPTEYGFNTHIFANPPGEIAHLGIQTFENTIDQLAAEGQQIVRFTLRNWELAAQEDENGIHWNKENLAIYDRAIDYAKSKGIKVFLVTNLPDFAKDYLTSACKRVAKEYYTFLAERYRGQVAYWQIFNEADVHDYQKYEEIKTFDEGYAEKFAGIVAEGAAAIKAADPGTQVTTNVSGWIGTEGDMQERWFKFFDPVHQSLDFLTVDLYPDDNIHEIGYLPHRIKNLQNRYSDVANGLIKRVAVGEIGLPTSKFTEEKQGHFLSEAIKVLKQGEVKPLMILPYEYIDESGTGNEGTFGLKRKDGSKKTSYDVVIDEMHTDEVTTEQAPQ